MRYSSGLGSFVKPESQQRCFMMFGFQICQKDEKKPDCKSPGHFKVVFDGDLLKML